MNILSLQSNQPFAINTGRCRLLTSALNIELRQHQEFIIVITICLSVGNVLVDISHMVTYFRTLNLAGFCSNVIRVEALSSL